MAAAAHVRPVDDLSVVPASDMDKRDALPVTAATLLAATSNSSEPGGITGWLLHFNGTLAYVVVGFLAFAEAALMVGFFIPGETAVVVGGVLAGLGRVNLGVMMVVVIVCAVIGDSVGFEVGKRAGPWLLQRRPPFFWRDERPRLRDTTAVNYTLGLLERYGGPAVFLGRFIAFARAVIPGLAGMSGLRYRTFLFWNVLGAIAWGVGYTLLGYVVGVSFAHVLGEIGLWSLGVVAVLVAAVVVIQVRRRRKEQARIRRQLSGTEDPGKSPVDGGLHEPGPGTVSTEDQIEDPLTESEVRSLGSDPEV
jgi:membrane protein DedA with SNARE-associated domain